jgi:hypothetical protein
MRAAHTLTTVPAIDPGRVYTIPESAIVTRYCARVLYDELSLNKLKPLPSSGRGRKLIMGSELLRWLNAPAPSKESEAA